MVLYKDRVTNIVQKLSKFTKYFMSDLVYISEYFTSNICIDSRAMLILKLFDTLRGKMSMKPSIFWMLALI